MYARLRARKGCPSGPIGNQPRNHIAINPAPFGGGLKKRGKVVISVLAPPRAAPEKILHLFASFSPAKVKQIKTIYFAARAIKGSRLSNEFIAQAINGMNVIRTRVDINFFAQIFHMEINGALVGFGVFTTA